jgi:hypothetical protein
MVVNDLKKIMLCELEHDIDAFVLKNNLHSMDDIHVR